MNTLTPIFPTQEVLMPAGNNYDPAYEDNGMPKLSPVSGLFDTNTVDPANPEILFANNIGLAEYTNTNFFSQDTIFTYPHPSKEETTYKKTLILWKVKSNRKPFQAANPAPTKKINNTVQGGATTLLLKRGQ